MDGEVRLGEQHGIAVADGVYGTCEVINVFSRTLFPVSSSSLQWYPTVTAAGKCFTYGTKNVHEQPLGKRYR